jgi:hypothetical protein
LLEKEVSMFNIEAVKLFFFELAGSLQAALDYLQNDQDISTDEVHDVEIDEVYPGKVPGYWRVYFPEFDYECWVTSYSRDGYYDTKFETIVGQSLAA